MTQLRANKIARLIIIKGRRRIGKSRLLAEFGKKFEHCYIFSGLPPSKGISAKDQRQEFAKQLNRTLGLRGLNTNDWGDLFWHLAQQTASKKILIVLDEITWMAQGDPTFLPKLKNAWDLEFKKNDNLILAICGSISAWIEKNILHSTGFLGRTSLNMTLEELPLKACLAFWDKNSYISTQDQLIMLSVTGGIPRYLEEINNKQTAIQNISRLCFDKDGILFNEFEHIFSDLFAKKNNLYKNIVNILVKETHETKDIATTLNIPQNGDLYEHLNDLIMAGFVTRYYSWNFSNGNISKLSNYRLTDHYCRFYLKYILPNKNRIHNNNLNFEQFSSLPGFSAIIGLQFENLVLKNRDLILQALNINSNNIISDNPYFQRKNSKQEACQIDYLIQTNHNTLFICEIKFTTKIIKIQVIEEVKQKIQKLKKPKNFSCIPVLIYFGELQETIEDSGYFTNIINFEDYITEK